MSWRVDSPARIAQSSLITIAPIPNSEPSTSSTKPRRRRRHSSHRFFDAWGVAIDSDLAHCLYAGLVTDTGSFRWGGPLPHVLAARLLATGIDGDAIARKLLDTHPFGVVADAGCGTRVRGCWSRKPRTAVGAGVRGDPTQVTSAIFAPRRSRASSISCGLLRKPKFAAVLKESVSGKLVDLVACKVGDRRVGGSLKVLVGGGAPAVGPDIRRPLPATRLLPRSSRHSAESAALSESDATSAGSSAADFDVTGRRIFSLAFPALGGGYWRPNPSICCSTSPWSADSGRFRWPDWQSVV